MKFNINQHVHVRLTSLGHKLLREQYKQLCRDIPSYNRVYVEPKPDADGYVSFQMHDLINRFGGYMQPGCDLPFDTDIKFSEPIEKHENSFKHFDLDEKLRILDSLSNAFKATQYSVTSSEIEAKISELLESLKGDTC